MPLYYFHSRDGVDLLLDPEGRDLEDAAAVAQSALTEARSIISHDALLGQILLDQHIDVEDSSRRVVHSINFADAIEIVGGKSD